MGYVQEEVERAIGKKWLKRVYVVGILFVIYFIISFALSLWPFSSAVGVAKTVTEPGKIVYNYEWFYDQYHAIQAQEQNIKILPEGGMERIGAQMVLNNMIATYNARSRQITRNIWKANDLPYQIEEEK